MAATAADLAKLPASDLTAKLKDEVEPRLNELAALADRDPEQEAELIDRLDEAEAIQNALKLKSEQEIKARLENVRRFDAPKPRKSGRDGASLESFTFGERLRAVANYRSSGMMDQRLQNALGANEGTPSDGGFLVGSDAERDLMSKVYGSPILSLIPRTPISAASNMLKLRLLKENSRADGSRQGGVQAFWEGEGQATTASQREYEELELTLRKLMAITYATSELLEDVSALEAETSAGFNEEMTFKVEDAVINGDGVGKPLGILNSPAKIAVAAAQGQNATTPLVYENIVSMWARLHPRSQTSAIWLVDQTLIPSLMMMAIPVGTGGAPVYQPSNGAADAPFGTLLGRPTVFTEYTRAANTEGDIILWDPTSYRIIEKGGIRGASSMHVAFLTDETAFRFIYRANGASKWRSPLTPKNGGATLSNIVTLATRT